jgi:hypothetical protein
MMECGCASYDDERSLAVQKRAVNGKYIMLGFALQQVHILDPLTD